MLAKILAPALLLPLFFLGSAFFLHRQSPGPQELYLELSAITAEGQAVSGAQVFIQNQMLGVSDSFGHWRKSVSLPASPLLNIRIEKSTADGEQFASKNLPFPRLSRVESHPSAPVQLTLKLNPRKIAGGLFASVWFQLLAPADSEKKSTQAHFRWLEQQLLPVLQREAVHRGMRLQPTSSWQIGLNSIEIPEATQNPALIRINAQNLEKAKSLDFMVAATQGPAQVVQEIFKKLKLHLDDQFALRGWQKYTLALPGLHPRGADVFIAGIKAIPRGNNSWEYWGRDKQQANLSVVEENRVTFRRRIVMGRDSELRLDPSAPRKVSEADWQFFSPSRE